MYNSLSFITAYHDQFAILGALFLIRPRAYHVLSCHEQNHTGGSLLLTGGHVWVHRLARSTKRLRCSWTHTLESLIRDVHYCLDSLHANIYLPHPLLCLCVHLLRFPDKLYPVKRNKTQLVCS